ncbi:MAG TPA: hypothetical protein VJX67_04245, partial [Blastocatellia bacterium]|nr:hypothetical protein [Blastocatellia bacterium]
MDTSRVEDEDAESRNSKAALYEISKQAAALARKILARSIAKRDGHLKEMIDYGLLRKSPSDYAFVFNYSFVSAEEDVEKIRGILAAIYLAQSAMNLLDDIFDASKLRY